MPVHFILCAYGVRCTIAGAGQHGELHKEIELTVAVAAVAPPGDKSRQSDYSCSMTNGSDVLSSTATSKGRECCAVLYDLATYSLSCYPSH